MNAAATGSPAARKWLSALSIVIAMTAPVHHVVPDTDGRETYNWAHPNEVEVADEEMAFTSRRLGAAKNEGLYVWVYSAEGTMFLFCMFHIEARLVNRWGMYVLTVDPAGEVHWTTGKSPTGAVAHSETALEVSDGITSFTGEDGVYRLEGRVGEISFDLDLASRLPPWKPGTGRLDYTQDGQLFQTRVQVAPWAWASGTITAGGTSFRIDGHGSVEKTRFSNPLPRFASCLQSLRLYHDNQYLYMLEITLCEAYGSRVLPTFGLAERDRWVFTSRDYELTVEEWASEAGLPYRYPTAIRIECESEGYVLEGVYRESRRLCVTDVLGELPFVARSILTTVFSYPMYIRATGTFTGTLIRPDGSSSPLNLQGTYEYAVVR